MGATQIARTWTHSYEEDFEGHVVYRPADFAFPLGRRPRGSLQLEPCGRVRRLDAPAPDDRRTAADGTWELDDDELVLRLEGSPDERYRIESADEQRLVLRRMG